MALNKYAIRVDPQGQAVTVDVLDMAGVSVAVFESQQFGAAKRTLPLTITAPTDFWLQTAGTFDVSCKVGGSEVADAGRARRVQVSDVPTLVVPDWERQRAASSGGSSAVAGQGAWYSAVELTLAAGVNNIVFNPEDAQFPSTLDITANEVVAVIGGLDYSTSDASNKVTFTLNHMRNSTPTVEADGVVASTRSVSGTDQANAVPSLEIVVEGPDITGYAWLTVTQFT